MRRANGDANAALAVRFGATVAAHYAEVGHRLVHVIGAALALKTTAHGKRLEEEKSVEKAKSE